MVLNQRMHLAGYGQAACLAPLLEDIALPSGIVAARQHHVEHAVVLRCAVLGTRHVAQVLPGNGDLASQERVVDLRRKPVKTCRTLQAVAKRENCLFEASYRVLLAAEDVGHAANEITRAAKGSKNSTSWLLHYAQWLLLFQHANTIPRCT